MIQSKSHERGPARLPALFISHGPPTLPLEKGGATAFLKGLGKNLPRPRAVLIVSAHWETRNPAVSKACWPETIHDFSGFPRQLYELNYPAPGAPQVAERAWHLLRTRFAAVTLHDRRGLDHGAWVPMLLMYPEAEIPVFQVSIQHAEGALGAWRLGEALAPLREEGVMIIGSGSLTHNLMLWHQGDDRVPDWSSSFADWMTTRVRAGDREALLDYREQAPFAEIAHPRDEHLLPLFSAMASGRGGGTPLFEGYNHGGLAMHTFQFEG